MNKLKKRVLIVMALIMGILFGLSGVMTARADAPNNDDIGLAVVIPGFPFENSVDTTEATASEYDPLPWCYDKSMTLERTVWYTFQSDRAMTLAVTAEGTNYTYITSIYYESMGNLEFVGCNFGGSVVPVHAGRNYYVMFSGYSTEPPPQIDQYILNTQFYEIPGPVNDYFDNRTEVTTMPFDEYVDISTASFEPWEMWPSCYYYTPSKSIWYAYTPDQSGHLQGYTDYWGSTAIWEGASLESLQQLDCRNWAEMISVPVTAGTTYYIQFSYPSELNWVYVHLNFISPPDNDMFANREVITDFPYFSDNIDLTLATLETNEPIPSCMEWYGANNTIWYEYVPMVSSSIMATASGYHFIAIYTGSEIYNLTENSCTVGERVTRMFTVGTRYYIQIGSPYWNAGSVEFSLEVPPPPESSFGYSPSDPTIYDDISFYDWSSDPAGGEITFWEWNFGDGTTASGQGVGHRYTQDGSYTVQLTITTIDGRTATTSQSINVQTHDVAITRFQVPTSASSGQTRQINVEINNKRYPETVRVELYKTTPYGDVYIGTLTQYVPVRPSNRTTNFAFSYTFTPDDAIVGKVTFKAYAYIEGYRDALPGDNQAISMPVKIGR